MSRLPALGFAALVLATVAAFFITQHLKVSTPLIAGYPAPAPAVIDPYGSRCGGASHTVSRFSFYLLNRADRVTVRIVDAAGRTVRRVAVNHPMRVGVRNPDGDFSWDGRLADGRIAPDGAYLVKVDLLGRGRTVTIANAAGPEPVRVKTRPPQPRVTLVQPGVIRVPNAPVRIAYAGNESRGGTIRLFRTDALPDPEIVGLRLVKSFLTPWRGQEAVWNARIDHRPAAQGTYLVGLDVTDAACLTGHFPDRFPPRPGSTARAGVTVRYLSATGPPAGAMPGDTIVVRSPGPVRWSLGDGRRELAGGSAGAGRLRLSPLPGVRAGLLVLRLASPLAAVRVPVLVPGAAAARVRVILPMLGWRGQEPIDESGDGLPDRLSTGDVVAAVRPWVGGPLPGLAEAQAIARAADGVAPTGAQGDSAPLAPAGRGAPREVILVGERLVPAPLAAELGRYLRAGGRVVFFGAGSTFRLIRAARGTLRPGPARSGDLFGVPARAPCAPAPASASGSAARVCILTLRRGRGTLVEIRDDSIALRAQRDAGLRGLLAGLIAVRAGGR